jgi:DNA-binding NtrC family response regulator
VGGRTVVAYQVHVVSGPDTGAVFRLDPLPGTRVLIGQASSCDVRLTDPRVSRRHASLDVLAGKLRVADLGSTNGTFVNNVSVGEAFLSGGEHVRLGTSVLRIDARALPEALDAPGETSFGRVVGASPEMQRLYPLCSRLANANVPVLIEGETGTGKEVLAEALHERGPRAGGPFVVFDCTATPPSLLEAALFGHERGAFTGAVDARRGVFEQAHKGTLFIDEIGDLDLALQSKLLRAIERSEIRRVGGERWTKVDTRILSATRRDLDREVQAGRFRDDLFFRLAVGRIELPPLRRRRADVPVLAAHFWRILGGAELPLPPELLRKLADYDWPGNVRELHNTIARYLAVGDMAEWPGLREEAIAPPAQGPVGDPFASVLDQSLPFSRAKDLVVEAFTLAYVERVLQAHGGNVTAAAAASGIGRRYFQRLKARQLK